MGVGRGVIVLPWNLKFDIFLLNFWHKGRFSSFEWVTLNFATFGPPWKNIFGDVWTNSLLVPPLEKILPTPMSLMLLYCFNRRYETSSAN